MTRRTIVRTLAVAVATAALTGRADATPLITNGGFESGFAGWTRIDLAGSNGTFALQSGGSSPVNGFAVPAPPQGTTAAMTDAEGPGSHLLYQDFVVPALTTSGVLSFQYYVNNQADDFHAPATLDFSTPALNQRARVDILRPGLDPFSIAAGDVLFTGETSPGDPLVEGYVFSSVDISSILTANIGETLRLRFSEVDNVNFFSLGLDDVRIETNGTTEVPVPEPASLVLVGSGLAAALRRFRRVQ